jgi:hypothetical protein
MGHRTRLPASPAHPTQQTQTHGLHKTTQTDLLPSNISTAFSGLPLLFPVRYLSLRVFYSFLGKRYHLIHFIFLSHLSSSYARTSHGPWLRQLIKIICGPMDLILFFFTTSFFLSLSSFCFSTVLCLFIVSYSSFTSLPLQHTSLPTRVGRQCYVRNPGRLIIWSP